MRELLARVPLVIRPPDDVPTGREHRDEHSARKRAQALLGLLAALAGVGARPGGRTRTGDGRGDLGRDGERLGAADGERGRRREGARRRRVARRRGARQVLTELRGRLEGERALLLRGGGAEGDALGRS